MFLLLNLSKSALKLSSFFFNVSNFSYTFFLIVIVLKLIVMFMFKHIFNILGEILQFSWVTESSIVRIMKTL